MKTRRVVSGLVFLLVVGCAAPQTRDGSTPNMQGSADSRIKVEPEARSLYYQAERAFNAKRFDSAVEGFSSVRRKFPRGKAAMLATYRLATIFYYRAQYPEASKEFEVFLSRYPATELSFDVTYNLAASEYQQGNLEKANATLAKLRPSEVQAQGPRRAEVVYQLVASVASGLNYHANAVSAYAAMLQLPLDDKKREKIEADIDDQLARIAEKEKLDRLLAEVSEPGTRNRISARLASLTAVEAGQTPPTAGNVPGAPVAGSPIPTSGELGAPGAPGELGTGTSGDSNAVGVVLPLSGKSGAYGRKALEGILLATGAYSRAHAANYKIYVEDSQSNPAVAQAAVEQLVSKNRVMAVIGPIGWKESLAVADKAQELGILNLSLTGKQGISERGGYLFQNALTPGVQLENMVKYAIGSRRFKRFAILAPRNAFGEDMANEFWDLVEKNGGRIVSYETYSPDERDFQAIIRSMTGLADPRDRAMENAKLAQYIKEVKEKTKREPKSARLQPIVDFDAIFLPDSPKVVGQISASLAYFDVRGAALLGTTEWNSDQLYRRGGRYVEGAMFPGGLSLNSRNSRQREFIKLYAEAYGTAPDLLASQAFEAMQVVGAALRESGSSDRNALVKEIAGLKGFEGPLGELSFDTTRIARRAIPVFTLEAGGNIVEQ